MAIEAEQSGLPALSILRQLAEYLMLSLGSWYEHNFRTFLTSMLSKDVLWWDRE